MMGPAHPVQALSVRHLALAVLSHAMLQKALRHASGDWRETVLTGGSVLPQKQRDRARRRQRLASETAEERERQRRVRDRARRAALSSPTRETGLEHIRARQQERMPPRHLQPCVHALTSAQFS